MDAILTRAIDQLASIRPVFHSEADFQFALAWQCQTIDPEARIRLEVPLQVGTTRPKLDILVVQNSRRIGIELKYLKAGLDADHDGESYRLKNVGAHDLGRYDILKDIVRLEAMQGAGQLDAGYAITLTNDSKYWESRPAGRRIDELFGIEEGRLLEGELRWADHVGGTVKGRESSLHFRNLYRLHWQDYSNVPTPHNSRFRFLCVQVAPGNLPVAATVEPSAAIVPPVAYPQAFKGRKDYSALKSHLASMNGSEVTLAISEIGEIVGGLPPSARNYSAWWGNHARNPQARWLDAGWKVSGIRLSEGMILFCRL